MDARPQRPVRAFHAQGDENVPPLQTKQGLHQRHKSTGTLSNMLAIGTLKGVAKRTAFGDVSNTMKNVTSIKDEPAAAVKANVSQMVKPLVLQEKPAAFLRPAQRPLNSAAVKAVIHNSLVAPTDSEFAKGSSKVVAAEPRQAQALGSKRSFVNRGTAIYNDNQIQDIKPLVLKPQPSAPLVESASLSFVHHSTTAIRPPIESSKALNRTAAQQNAEQLNPVDSKSLKKVISIEQQYEDAPEQQGSRPSAQETGVTNDEVKPEEQSAPIVQPSTKEALERLHRQLPALPMEHEEYWDEDEDDEVYDEQGYTTAHSYRSKGDNTTGGATTVLFPKVTNKIKKELAAAKELIEKSRTQDEIEDEAWDTSMVAEYGDEIFAYMRELEIKMLPNAHYMDLQAEIQWSMRSVLMDWLIQVHHRFSLLPETLFLCVNYIDRFLSCKIVSLGKLQLVGATAIFVAAKYEEINCPSVNEIVYMVDGGYTIDEILKAERFMLSMLQFELGWPGPMSFLRRISKADDYDLETRTLAKYFLEVTIMDERFVGSPPSYIAAGAHCFSRSMLKKGDWTSAHTYYSGYTWTQLRPLVSMIMECCENPQKHHAAVFEKYSDRRYKRASLFVQAEMQRGYNLPAFTTPRASLPSPGDAAGYYETRDSFTRLVQLKG